MQTASLDDDGRMIIIRSLPLGRLSLQASATEWSRRVEQRAREAKVRAVFAESPAAAGADVVWFPNAIEVWTSLAVRTARGLPCLEWFWRTAANGWNPHAEPAATLRQAFQRVIALGGLPASFLLGRRLAAERMLLPLLRAFTVEDVRPWLPTPEFDRPIDIDSGVLPVNSTRTESPPPVPLWPHPWESIAVHYLREFPRPDVRLLWLAATALSSTSPLPPSIPAARQLAAEVSGKTTSTPDGSNEAQARPSNPVVESSALSPDGPPAAFRTAPIPQASELEPRRTRFGGLLFVVPLFERLGLPTWPNATDTGWAAFSLIVQHCRRGSAAGDDDPLVQLFATATQTLPAPFVLNSLPLIESTGGPRLLARWNATWRVLLDASGRLPVAAWRGSKPGKPIKAQRPIRRTSAFPDSFDPCIVGLALGAHRLCRRITGLGLKSLVRRPARAVVTETHLDLYFRPIDADVRIRRAALDINPGWVPWLGRIVSFHFTTED